MNTGPLFVTVDGLRAMLGAIGRWLLWSLAMTAVLLAGTAVVVLPGREDPQGPETHLFVLAYLEDALSEEEINRLAWETWRWPETVQQGFRFAGEGDPKDIPRRALVLEVDDEADRVRIEDRLHTAAGVAGVEQLRRTIVPPPRLPATSRILALVGLVVSLTASLFLGRWTMAGMADRWRNELTLLRHSGLRETVLRMPFLSAGAAAGLLAAMLYVASYWAVWSWSQGVPAVRQAAPLLTTSGPAATALGLVVALALGVLGGVLGYPPQQAHSRRNASTG